MTYLAAIVMGFIGSFHCVAMCGAIALSLRSSSNRAIVQRQLLYNVGRVLSYMTLAALFHSMHALAFVNRGQNILSLVLGGLLFLVSLLFLLDIGPVKQLNDASLRFFALFRSLFLRGRSSQALGASLLVGYVNGFLPCGFVYVALASALTQPYLSESVIFMALFGLGTIPSMIALVIMSKAPSIGRIVSSGRFLSVASAIAGLMLLIRGLALGIPYISPKLPDTVQVLSDIKHEQLCRDPQRK